MNYNVTIRYILLALIVGGLLYVASSFIVNQQQATLVGEIKAELTTTKEQLATLAERIDTDQPDEITTGIVRSCTSENQSAFDVALNTLTTLNQAQLQAAEQLFDACARTFSERKGVMVERLALTLRQYKSLLSVLTVVDGKALDDYKFDEWSRLVTLEQERSALFIEQADIQLEVIEALQAGELVGSEVLTRLLNEAQNVTEGAIVINSQIDGVRQSLLAL